MLIRGVPPWPAAKALAALVLASIALRFVPLERLVRRPSAGRPAARRDLRLVERLIAGWAARLPIRAKCIEQGVAAHWLLGWSGYSSTLHYGAANRDGQLAAHVWVTSGDEEVIGCAERHDFTELARFPAS